MIKHLNGKKQERDRGAAQQREVLLAIQEIFPRYVVQARRIYQDKSEEFWSGVDEIEYSVPVDRQDRLRDFEDLLSPVLSLVVRIESDNLRDAYLSVYWFSFDMVRYDIQTWAEGRIFPTIEAWSESDKRLRELIVVTGSAIRGHSIDDYKFSPLAKYRSQS